MKIIGISLSVFIGSIIFALLLFTILDYKVATFLLEIYVNIHMIYDVIKFNKWFNSKLK
jgi:hypothetical protein